MDLGKAVIVAGIGFRRNAKADDMVAAITTALDHAGLSVAALSAVATSEVKASEAARAAAAAIGVPLVAVGQADLEAAAPRTLTKSERSIAAAGVPSLAEAAALAAAGPDARLLRPRIVVGPATCALAQAVDAAVP